MYASPVASCFTLYLRAIFKHKLRGERGAYIWRGNLMEGFLRYEFGGLIFVGGGGGLYMEGLIFGFLR